MPRQVFELQQEFGGANFLTASRLFVKEGDLTKVNRWEGSTLCMPPLNSLSVYKYFAALGDRWHLVVLPSFSNLALRARKNCCVLRYTGLEAVGVTPL